MPGLKKINIAAAKKMRGTDSKNLFKRAWKIQKAKARGRSSRSTSGTKRTTPKRSKSPGKSGGRKMARKKDINVSLSNLAGVLLADQYTGLSGEAVQVMDGAKSVGDALNQMALNMTNTTRMKDAAVPLGGIAVAKMLLGRRQIGRLGPLSVRV